MAQASRAPSSRPQGYGTAASAAWATTTVVLGLAVLAGWVWDVGLLKSVFPGVVEMKANTAAGLVLAGVSLRLLKSARAHAGLRWTGLAAAGLTLLLGALTLSQFVFGRDLGIDQLLFRDPAGAVSTAIPGRMSWLTAVDFVLMASALILLGTRRAIVAIQILATTVGLSALGAIGAYLLGQPEFFGAKVTPMAVHTALGFLLLAVGAGAASRDRGVVVRARRHLAIIGPLAAGAVFLLLVLASFLNLRRAQEVHGWIERTGRVQAHLQALDTEVQRIGAGARGFLATGDDDFLAPVAQAREALPRALSGLQDLTADDPRQREHVAALRTLVLRRVEMGNELVRLRRESGQSAGNEYLARGETERVAADIGEHLAWMTRVEQERLTRQRAANASATVASQATSLVLGLLGLGFLLAMLAFWRRSSTTFERRVAERTQELERSNRALRMLTDCNQTLIRATDETQLVQSICELGVALGGYRFCFVGYAERDEAKTFRVVASAGVGVEQLPFASTWADEGARTVSGTAIRTGRPAVLDDLSTDDAALAKFGEAIRQLGLASAAALPLESEGRAFGALTFVSAEPGAFDEDEPEVLDELAKNLSFGIGTLRAKLARQEAEEAVRKTRASLDTALFSMTDAVVISDAAGNFTEMNEAFATFYKFKSKAECAKTLKEYPEFLEVCTLEGQLVPPEDWGLFRLLRGEEVKPVEYRLRRKDTGETWDGSYTFSPLRDSHGALVGAVVVIRDVTERNAVQAAARAKDERFRLMLNLVDMVVWAAKPDGSEMLEATESFTRIYGVSVAEFLADPGLWLEVVHPDDRAIAEQSRQELFATGHAKAEYRIVRPDGTIRWLLDEKSALCDQAGQVIQIGGVALDVTESKRVEEELARHKNHLEDLVRERTEELSSARGQLQLVLDSAGDGIYGVGRDGSCTFVNRSALALLGHSSADEVLGRNNHALWHHTRADGRPYDVHECPIYQVLQGGPAGDSQDEHFWRKDGTSFPVEYRTRRLERDGEIVGCVVSFMDITERKRIEAELIGSREAAQSANHAKSAFLANMSHEIRTPMNAVLGFTQLLLRDPATTPAQREHLGTIARAGDHLLSLIDDILQLARVESGRVVLHETVFELSAVLADLEVLFREHAREQGLRLLVEGVAPLPRYIRADEAKLRQILTNLIGNAVKFTDHGGVAVRARAHDGKLVVEVEDSGPGIAPDELPRLFQKFEQTASGRQAKQGTGLGLAISREFAQLMGGQIGATSRPGEGSVFRLELPLQEGAEADLQRRAPTRRVTRLVPGPTRYRILVVDDKEDNRTFLTALLEAVGFDTAQAADGEEALRAFEDFEPHVVLMDMRMPVMDGAEAIGRLRATPQGRAVKIVAVTASAFEEDREVARVAGADDFVSKPFRESVLFEKLAALLGVEYEYEAQVDAAPVQAAKADMDVTCERLAVLPAELREQIRQATLVADLDTVLDLLELAKAHDAELAAQLRALAEKFAYQQLLELLRPEEGNT